MVPVSALRRLGDLGIGDTQAVIEMIDWCADNGLSVLQILPINETGADNSPYNAISSVAIDPATLTVEPGKVPGLTQSLYDHIVISSHDDPRYQPSIDYAGVKSLKLRLLWAAYQKAGALLTLNQWIKREGSWVAYYTLFRLLMDFNGGSTAWETWPEEHRTPDAAKLWVNAHPKRTELGQRLRFYAFLQMVAEEQWTAVRRHADRRGVLIMGDIPFGVSRGSVDVWASQELFSLRWSVGCPADPAFKPDAFTARWGQNWGVPVYNWEAMAADDFNWWRTRVRAATRYFHLFRIDHVTGLYRVFAFPWQPQDNDGYANLSPADARKRAGGEVPRYLPGPDHDPRWARANLANGEKRLAIIQETAGEAGVVAEDLGKVPPYLAPSLERMGVPGFRIPFLERTEPERAYKDARQYPALSVATLATHDQPPIAALWQQWHDALAADHGAEHAEREQRTLLQWVGWGEHDVPMTFNHDLHLSIIRTLLQSSSALAIIHIADWFGWPDRISTPGPPNPDNWTWRMPHPITIIAQDPVIARHGEALRDVILETGRLPE